jgi:Co/Zn/Cd efflux system component
MPEWEPEEEADSRSRIVTVAIYVNLVANTVLLILKVIVALLTSSVSVLASMVDAALDFLSTAIVFVTTRLINRKSASERNTQWEGGAWNLSAFWSSPSSWSLRLFRWQ